jgi:hypothetical protein
VRSSYDLKKIGRVSFKDFFFIYIHEVVLRFLLRMSFFMPRVVLMFPFKVLLYLF